MFLNFQTLLLKSTKKCNATCTHCSAIKNKQRNLTLEDAKNIIDKVAKYVFGRCSLIFHGGEPMLMGVDFYKELIEYIENKYPNKFTYAMQSNFLLYNKEWFELISKYKIGMSTSYDFYSDIRNLGGNVKKYYDIWYKNIKQFQKDMSEYLNTDFYPYVINIVNKQNHKKIKEIYEIAKKEKFNIRHNYFYKVGRGDKNSEKYYIEPEDYGKFLVDMFNLWINDALAGNIDINFFKVYPSSYFVEKVISIDNGGHMCPWLNTCGGTFLAIEPTGVFYNCSEMADINGFPYGNIFEIDDLKEIILTENFQKIYQRRRKLPKECLSCKYYKYCQGGCMRDSYINERNFGNLYGKTWACKAWYMIFEEVLKYKNFFEKVYVIDKMNLKKQNLEKFNTDMAKYYS